jgi:hypothetical protein
MQGPIMVFVVGGGVIAFVVLVAWASRVAARKRQEALAQLALALGLTFNPGPPSIDLSGDFHVFRRGRARVACNTLSGAWRGLPLEAFDYRFTEGGGKESHVERLSIGVVTLGRSLPYLSVHQRGLFRKLAHLLGFKELVIDSDRFNQRCHATAADPDAARALLGGALGDYLAQAMEAAPFSLELSQNHLLVERSRLAPDSLAQLLDLIKDIHDRLPPDVAARTLG